jgi:ketosteroid isomerase-like protein
MAAMEARDEMPEVALVRRAVDAWNANDWELIESLNHPDVTIRAPDGWPESGEFHGWSAVRRQFERLKDAWSEERIEPIEIRPLDGGKVFLRAQWRGHGGASGLELDMEIDVIYTLRAGKLARSEFFIDPDAARRAAAGEGGGE